MQLDNLPQDRKELVLDLMGSSDEHYLKHFMPAVVHVADKRGQKVPMRPTDIHLKFNRTQKRLSYVLKPRQVYFTTYGLALSYLTCLENPNITCAFYNLKDDVTTEVFTRCRDFHEWNTFRVDPYLKRIIPNTVNNDAQRLAFTNKSSINAHTVKNDGSLEQARTLSRSIKVQRFHGTECAFWRHFDAFNEGLMASIPKPDGRAVFETTGNGPDGGYYETFMSIVENGMQVESNTWHLGDQSAHFFEWWLHYEYKLDYNPFDTVTLNANTMKLLDESEKKHGKEMAKTLNSDQIKERMNFRRYLLLNEYKLLKDPQKAMVDCDREYPATYLDSFSGTGSSFLPMPMIAERRELAKSHNYRNQLPIMLNLDRVNKTVLPKPGTDILIWGAPHNVSVEGNFANRYVIGVDVGGGNADSDFDAIWVKDRLRNMYVAVSHGQWGPKACAEKAAALGYWYYEAYINFEVNNHGAAFALELAHIGYENVHKPREEHGDYRDWGWQNNVKSRNEGINLLYTVFSDEANPLIVHYPEYYREGAGFRAPPNKPNGKVEGQGVHDDLMMASVVTEDADAKMPPVELIPIVEDFAPDTIGDIKKRAEVSDTNVGLRNY